MITSTSIKVRAGTIIWKMVIDGVMQDVLHREDGPAIEYVNGDRAYYQHNLLHRLDGPAFHHISGYGAWYYQGQRLDCETQEEFETLLKLKAFW